MHRRCGTGNALDKAPVALSFKYNEKRYSSKRSPHITQESITRCASSTALQSVARGATRGIEEMCVTLRFSLKILGKLVSSGIVRASQKGNRGGYELARPASEITLKDVIDAVEGPYRLSRCVGEGGAGECNRGASGCCTFQKVFHDISKSINEQLAAVNFQMLLEEPAGK